jgi:hypothetical protein
LKQNEQECPCSYKTIYTLATPIRSPGTNPQAGLEAIYARTADSTPQHKLSKGNQRSGNGYEPAAKECRGKLEQNTQADDKKLRQGNDEASAQGRYAGPVWITGNENIESQAVASSGVPTLGSRHLK